MAFTAIVLGQVGVLMACRSERRSAWSMLRQPNGLLGMGVVSELLLTAALVLVPTQGSIVSRAPFPVAFLPWMALGRLSGIAAPVASIGGAGTFDSIFVTGIVAVLLA